VTKDTRPLIAASSMGDCIHLAGILNFLRLAENCGYRTVLLGQALSPEEIVEKARELKPDVLAVGYRLSPEPARRLLERLRSSLEASAFRPRLVFGGTPPVAEVARASGLFEAVFSGLEDVDEVVAYLKGKKAVRSGEDYPSSLVERIRWKEPYPLLRHHFGLPSLKDTVEGVRKIAEARVLDVISLGPDQNAQESFFRPEEMDPDQDGAGGVPVRTAQDFRTLYEASRCGNFPLMRCYSGTRDVLRFAELLKDTINNAWAAIPLFWYNVLDKRSPRGVEESIREAQAAIKWHAARSIPVEVNEAHHWSLRDAPDTVAVAAAFLAAYNAKKAGVTDYIAQFMWNTPAGTSPVMDVGKMLAKLELVESLADGGFRIWKQVRAGLLSFPADLGVAKGHLGSSVLVSMSLKPHIVHVVGFCEGDHVATADDVVESAKIARGVIKDCLDGMPDMTQDARVQERKEELLRGARVILDALNEIAPPGVEDPWSDPHTLAESVKIGILDAPQLKGNPAARGAVVTRVAGGACRAIDPSTGIPVDEEERISRILEEWRKRQPVSIPA